MTEPPRPPDAGDEPTTPMSGSPGQAGYPPPGDYPPPGGAQPPP
ncbi:DUF4870 domain-containing protein, partial [Micromonospora craterilacus]